jgi:CHAT domain-containing protein/tetratricopeptide (TPR) repeat protein
MQNNKRITGQPHGARFFGFLALLLACSALLPAIRHLEPPLPNGPSPARDSAMRYFALADKLWRTSPREAIPLYQKSIRFAGLPPHPGCDTILVYALTDLGRCYGKLGLILPFDSCEYYHQLAVEQALASFGENNIHTAKSLNNLGGVYAGKGCPLKSVELRLRALRAAENTAKSEAVRIRLYTNLGLLYSGLGARQIAERYLTQAVKLIPKCTNEAYVCLNVLENYANFLSTEGRVSEAFEVTQSAEKFLDPEDTLSQIAHWQTLGKLYSARYEYEKALEYDSLCLKITETNILGPTDIAHAHYTLALNHFNLKHWDKSIAHLEPCIAIERKVYGEKFSLLVVAYHLLGKCYVAKGDNTRAMYFFNKSLAANNFDGCGTECLNDPGSSIGVFDDMAKLCVAAQDFIPALEYLKLGEQALNRYVRISQDNTAREEISKSGRPLYVAGVQVACRLWQQTGDPKYKADAFYFSEQSKAQILREGVLASDANRFANVPADVLKQEQAIKTGIAACEVTLLNTNIDSVRLATTESLFNLNRQQTELKAKLKDKYPNFFDTRYGHDPVKIGVLRNNLLRPDQELVEYFVGDSCITAFVLSAKRFDVIQIPLDFSLDTVVRGFLLGIYGDNSKAPNPGEYKEQLVGCGHLLYQKILAPLALTAPSIAVVPDGLLGALPFEALLTKAPLDINDFALYPYLIKKQSISYAPSATLMWRMHTKKHHIPPSQPFIAFVPFAQTGLDNLRTLFPDRSALRGSNMGALPFSLNEALAGKKAFMGHDTAVFVGARATKTRFVQCAHQGSILLLLLHGFAEPDAQDFAFLTFCPDPARPLDGFLFLKEIYALELNADLVLLPACETNIGQLLRSEGMLSISRAFSFAGAKSVVATFWAIETGPTADIMKPFYALLAKNQPKDLALQAAKVSYLSAEKSNTALYHPYYWAGIVAIGDMAPLH